MKNSEPEMPYPSGPDARNLSPRARRDLKIRQLGFTLIEVMIAIAMLGITAVTIYTGLGTAFTANTPAERQNVALTLAQGQLEYVNSLPYDAGTIPPHPQYPVITIPSLYSADYSITCSVTIDPRSSGTGDMQKITVIVFWKTDTLITLETYKVNR